MAQLCFEKRVTDALLDQDAKFCDEIRKLAADKSVKLKSLKKSTAQVVWLLDENLKKRKGQEVKAGSGGGEHILISFQADSKELCIKIRQFLEGLGHKVWFDIDDVNGELNRE